ncbi:hypothetical protein TNCV_118181 [Trichonephila clavipes]|nr:hypothetical protein TNCV_118181 [Trichonephila clavipes]
MHGITSNAFDQQKCTKVQSVHCVQHHSAGCVDGIVKHIIFCQGQKQTNAVKVQDYGNCILGPSRCFAGGLHATRNNDQLRCLLRNSTEAPNSIAKQMAWHAVKRYFAPPR